MYAKVPSPNPTLQIIPNLNLYLLICTRQNKNNKVFRTLAHFVADYSLHSETHIRKSAFYFCVSHSHISQIFSA